MKTAIGYIRVSTEGQATKGVSLDAQRAQIESWCNRNGYELEQVYVDAGLSGKRMRKRKGLQNALKAISKGTALVAYSISRLARSLPDMLKICNEVDRKGADLVSLTEQIDTTSAAGRMMLNMLAALAQYESEIIGERTHDAMQFKRAKGEVYCSVTPFGYKKVNGRLVEIKAEAEAIRRIITDREKGATLQAIADQLNIDGVPTKRGGSWQTNTVNQILKRHAA